MRPLAPDLFHVIVRAKPGSRLFRNEDDYAFFRNIWVAVLKKFETRMLHYCFLPEQSQFLFSGIESKNVSVALDAATRRYQEYLTKIYSISEKAFLEPQLIRLARESNYLQAGRYIERQSVT